MAGQLTIKYWMSPRDRIFINSYASIIAKSLKAVRNKRDYLCDLDKSFKNTFVIISDKNVISCHKQNLNFNTVINNNLNRAYVYKNRLISDLITINGERFWLSAIRNQPLYNTLVSTQVRYKLMAVLIFSALICFILARYLTLPLKTVRERMFAFSTGDLSSRVGDAINKRQDEFAEIGYEFDCMATSIQQLITSKQNMLYNVSHELRSPLARQLMTLDVLKISSREKYGDLLQKVEKENFILNELITEILMLAKLSTKTFSYNPRQTDLSELIKKSIQNINFEFSTNLIKSDVPQQSMAVVDPKLMTIVIENLLKNAVKHSGSKENIVITLRIKPKIIEITISDKGQGITQDDLPFIFEPFKQSHNETDRVDNGYGLGLAISKEIIELHSGTITAHNNQPRGLTITIRLPLNLV